MATYCIGDIHACFKEFMQLLKVINFDRSKDTIYLTGDVIGRGPMPVETMNFLLDHQDCIKTVLGNHDLNFLCAYYKGVEAKAKDNIQVLLDSSHLEDYVNYFKTSPLCLVDTKLAIAVCHASIYPLWSLEQALNYSNQILKVMQDEILVKILFTNMYADNPDRDNGKLSGLALWRFCLNAFTRTRFITKDYKIDFKVKTQNPQNNTNKNLVAWFDFKNKFNYQGQKYKLFFGHWAALQGQCKVNNIKALDTACVWGGELSAYCINNDKLYKVASKGYKKIKD